MEDKSVIPTRLKVGDKLYAENRMYGICAVLIVEKLTATQAVCGDYRFKIDLINGSRAKRIGQEYGSWNSTSYYLETKELKEKYERQMAVDKLKLFDFKKLSTETLMLLVNAISNDKL